MLNSCFYTRKRLISAGLAIAVSSSSPCQLFMVMMSHRFLFIVKRKEKPFGKKGKYPRHKQCASD